jgi:hypothetical protein
MPRRSFERLTILEDLASELAGIVINDQRYWVNTHWGGRVKVSTRQLREFLRARGYDLGIAWFIAFVNAFISAMRARGFTLAEKRVRDDKTIYVFEGEAPA